MANIEAAQAHHARIGLFGAAPDTNNMGVSALCISFLSAIHERIPGLDALVFDNGLGLRQSDLMLGDRASRITSFGARIGRRYHRPENLSTMHLLSGLPLAGRTHGGIRLIDSCAVILDASAGDSFSDIYGHERFKAILLPKLIAAQRRKPLILLPQTYGPFKSARCERDAAAAILGADLAWARDPRSYQLLRNMLGADFDPEIHRQGVDMAFGLPTRRPNVAVIEPFSAWLESDAPLVGLNVSGLIWNIGSAATQRFGFRTSYRDIVVELAEWLLQESAANILLVPHVFAASGTEESDRDASLELSALLTQRGCDPRRLRTVATDLSEQEAKWVISQCDWFCGTRMHSTIAALSTMVPTSSIVYSDKAAGIFGDCGQSTHVIDPRADDLADSLRLLQHSFTSRGEVAHSLATSLPSVIRKLHDQMDQIAAFVSASY